KAGDDASLHADVSINPTQVFLNDTVWNIRAAKVAIDSGMVRIDNFTFDHGRQYVRVNGVIGNHAADTCMLRLNQMNLSYILDMVGFDDVMFKGDASGYVMLKNVKGDMDLQARLDIDDFYMNGGLLGQTVIDAKWDKAVEGISLTADMQESDDNYTKVVGYVSPKRSELDLNIYPHGTSMTLLDYFTEGSVSDISGRVTGYVHLFGGFKTLDFEGGVIADNVKMKIDDINTSFVIPHDSVTLSAGRFGFPHIQVTDAEGNLGVLDGYISHRHLKKVGLHLKVDSRNMLFYDEREAGDNTFYGRLYGTGTMSMESNGSGIDIVGDVETGVGTTFTSITGINTEATSNQFITYVDKTPQRRHETVGTDIYHYQNARQQHDSNPRRNDLRIKVNIGVNKNAQMRVVMDPVSGDDIVAYGNGNLQIDYYNKGDFNVYGTYVVDEGKYEMSMQDIIHKELVLQQGGSVSFTGNSANTTIDMKAVHTVNSASLADLDANANMKGKVRVNCIMQLSGLLSDPDIKFDLELPQISEADRALVHAATNTEEMMNTQIIYLLGIGKFYAYDAANASQSSNGASSLAFSTLSGQLSNMLASWTNSTNWNVGANLSTGERGWTDVEAEAMLSGRLLNNRLQINGNFGYKEHVLSNTNFIGDFEAVWLLTENGEWRIRGYNETNDRYFYKNALNTQGIGLIYNKDFNRWSSLWRK
ncbi:MAG: translocation/assembly module TamB domain-containing protein, partial [Bacteroidales bacterium]|nr:translocation/assembly module TamB domain-containing protein [Bacteroidales bacterium]